MLGGVRDVQRVRVGCAERLSDAECARCNWCTGYSADCYAKYFADYCATWYASIFTLTCACSSARPAIC